MSDVAVVISSCDGYKFAWPPLCHGLNKYWPNPPWPVYLVTNHLDPPCMRALKVGKERGWTHATRTALQAIGTTVVLWIFEDHWLAAPPDVLAMKDYVNIILRGEADYIRLDSSRRESTDDTYLGDPRLFVVAANCAWRVTAGPVLWRVKTFLSLLREGESAWDFEIEGSKRARSNDRRFLCTKGHAWEFPTLNNPNWRGYQNPVIRGKWTAGAREYARREGITIDWESNPHGWR